MAEVKFHTTSNPLYCYIARWQEKKMWFASSEQTGHKEESRSIPLFFILTRVAWWLKASLQRDIFTLIGISILPSGFQDLLTSVKLFKKMVKLVYSIICVIKRWFINRIYTHSKRYQLDDISPVLILIYY